MKGKQVVYLSICVYILTLHIHGISGQFQCFNAPDIPEDRRTIKDRLVVAQYNCEWLFLGNSSHCPGDPCEWATPEDQNLHFENILSEIRELDADILNLVEIENCDVLQALVDGMPEKGYKAYMVQGTDTATGQNVGILTRIDPIVNMQRTATTCAYPLPNSECGGTREGVKTVSKHYYTQFMINDQPLIMMGMHLLSQPTLPSNCEQREAQACVLANLLDSMTSQYPPEDLHVIMIGDMNDYDDSVLDSAGHTPTSHALRILREGMEGSSRQFQLSNIASFEKNQTNRYTCWYDYYHDCTEHGTDDISSIDHILISPPLMRRVRSVEFIHDYENSCSNYYSDHWPLVLTLDWPTKTTDPPINNTGNHSNQNTTGGTVVIINDNYSTNEEDTNDMQLGETLIALSVVLLTISTSLFILAVVFCIMAVVILRTPRESLPLFLQQILAQPTPPPSTELPDHIDTD